MAQWQQWALNGYLATEVFDGVHADRSGSQGLGAALLVWMTPSGTML
jgi:hypothetical protein